MNGKIGRAVLALVAPPEMASEQKTESRSYRFSDAAAGAAGAASTEPADPAEPSDLMKAYMWSPPLLVGPGAC